jgi:hypothetical protein
MPIRQMLDNCAFNPKETALLRSVFEDTLRGLKLSDRDHPITTLVAKKIIEFASHGERDPSRLRQTAINFFRAVVEKNRGERIAGPPRPRPKSPTSPENSFSYGVSARGSDWCWELRVRGHVVGRGVARTQSRAYADALSAALAYTESAGVRHRPSRIATDRRSST